MRVSDAAYAPIAQSFNVVPTTADDQLLTYVPATHTFLAPESVPNAPLRELEGDEFDPKAPPIDLAHLKSLSGIIVTLIFTMLVISMYICLSRPDFSFPFLLVGYYAWCVRGQWSSSKIYRVTRGGQTKEVQKLYDGTTNLICATPETIANVQAFSYSLAAISVLDAIWIFTGFNAWTCRFDDPPKDHPKDDPTFCFDQRTERTLLSTYGIHIFALQASVINLSLKVLAVLLCTLWVLRQQKARA